ncbi:Aldo/keto reductase [Trametes gibbosa]|nr:Aldo/keto reductase [Trametes gibbosa]
MSLPTRKIGNSKVSSIGFGAMGIAAFYATAISEEERFKGSLSALILSYALNLLDSAYESGCTNWDTADTYNDSELSIGKWFKRTGKRSEIFLATKFGMAAGIPGRAVCGDPEYVPKALERSLTRLGVDYVDLWYLHRADQSVPIELTVRAMAEQVRDGKVKYLGLSEVSAATLRRAHAVHPISAVQVEYSPFTLDIEDEKIGLLKTARELGVAIVAYSPLGRGLLAGGIRSRGDIGENDLRLLLPRFSNENFPNVLKVVDRIKDIAKKYDATPGQITLAWTLAQGDEFIPIPGTTRIPNLLENLGAAKLQLAQEDVDEIRSLALAAHNTIGARYPVQWQGLSYADTPALQE